MPDPQLPAPQLPDLNQSAPSGTDGSAGDAAWPTGQPAAGDADAAQACFARGVALAESSRTLEAAQQFQQANLLRPDHPATLTNLGLLLSQLDQYDTALACVQRATDLRPDDPRAALARAVRVAGGDKG